MGAFIWIFKSIYNHLGLAVNDTFFILGVIARALPAWGVSVRTIYPVLYPILHISYSGSIFMTVLVSFERYMAVCWRMEPSVEKIKYYSGYGGILASITFNIPSMMIYKWDDQWETKLTDIACNEPFMNEYLTYVLNLTLRFVLPTISLVGFNFLVLKEVRIFDLKRTFSVSWILIKLVMLSCFIITDPRNKEGPWRKRYSSKDGQQQDDNGYCRYLCVLQQFPDF